MSEQQIEAKFNSKSPHGTHISHSLNHALACNFFCLNFNRQNYSIFIFKGKKLIEGYIT